MIIKEEKGVAVVEFAIILPLLLVLMFGIIEFSILLFNKAMITNASREGARAGIVFAETRPTPNEIRQIVSTYAENHLINFDPSQILDIPDPVWTDTNSDTYLSSGEPLTVTVNYTYRFLLFPNILELIKGSFTNTIDITAVSVMKYE